MASEDNSNQTDSSPIQDSNEDGEKNKNPANAVNHNNAVENPANEVSSAAGSKVDPGQLKALLEDNSGKKHNLILFRYTTSDGSVSPSGGDYPKKARVTLHNGDKVNLISGNKQFKIVPYSLLLDSQDRNSNNNKNKKLSIYMEKKGAKFVVPDSITAGIYHLYIKTEYTPSDDDVAYFIDTVKIDKITDTGIGKKKQTKPNSENNGNTSLGEKSKKRQLMQNPAKLNITIQTSTFNQTVPSDTVIKVTNNNISSSSNQSQYGNATTEFQSIPILAGHGQNITLMAISPNRSHIGNRIIKTANSLGQPITLQNNLTLETVRLNETKPEDMILQLNTTNSSTAETPITLQFVLTNQSVYRIELLSANQTTMS